MKCSEVKCSRLNDKLRYHVHCYHVPRYDMLRYYKLRYYVLCYHVPRHHVLCYHKLRLAAYGAPKARQTGISPAPNFFKKLSPQGLNHRAATPFPHCYPWGGEPTCSFTITYTAQRAGHGAPWGWPCEGDYTMPTINIMTDGAVAYGLDVKYDNVAPKGLDYLLAYGFKQSIGDAGTSAAAKAVADWAKALKEATGDTTSKAATDAWRESEVGKATIQAAVDAAQAKRREAIIQGTIGLPTDGYGKLTPFERFCFERAEADGRAQAKAVGARWPSDKDEANSLMEQIIELKHDEYRKAFDRLNKTSVDLAALFKK